MLISVVIPTFNRKPGLLALLDNLDHSVYPLLEVIIVDAGQDRLIPADYAPFTHLKILYITSEPSVCVQRNIGIQKASAPWIFLCDDDIEMPAGYLQQLMDHTQSHPEAGAVSGLVLQKTNGEWQSDYPQRSASGLVWTFVFQLGIWGEIRCPDNPLTRKIKQYYQRRGNHISKAGWPVLTDLSGAWFTTPLYGLGASLVKKDWLLQASYDEVLDRHGIGDNYGVAMGFPSTGIHVLNEAFVYHHQEPSNRLQRPLQYYRRTLALDYFLRTQQRLQHIKNRWLLWSLTGNFLAFAMVRDRGMRRAAWQSIRTIAGGHNPYEEGARNRRRIIEPVLPQRYKDAAPKPSADATLPRPSADTIFPKPSDNATLPRSSRKILWAVFILYILISGFSMARHELWGDELLSWNIAKASHSFSDLVYNRRYEGHPPGWHTILWGITKFSHNTDYMQGVQWLIACGMAYMMLFCPPFPLMTRIMVPFGYYFLYEYALFSRNYGIGVLLALCVCFVLRKDFRFKWIVYYILLFLLSNIHLLALILAGALHLYLLLWTREQKKPASTLLKHGLLGAVVFLPAILLIFPPSDAETNIHFWLGRWSIRQLAEFGTAPLRAFAPVPAWWKYNFWNSEFLLAWKENHAAGQFIVPFASLLILTTAWYILRKNKKTLLLFSANLAVSFIVAVTIFPLTAARYSGFLFIGFIAAYWLYCEETPVSPFGRKLVYTLLGVQLIAALFSITRDIRLPFSNLFRVTELIREVPPGSQLVTDYWTMNAVVAYTDQPAYCVDVERKVSFVLWASDMATIRHTPNRYTRGIGDFLRKEGIHSVYLVSMGSPAMLFNADPQLQASFHITLVDKREGAIEKGSNLYLYEIRSL